VLWVLVFALIALAGLVMVVCYAVWLVHKTADLLSEVQVLGDQAGELADLLGGLGAAPATPTPPPVGGTLLSSPRRRTMSRSAT